MDRKCYLCSNWLHLYVPFFVTKDEITDISVNFEDTKVLQATFSSACIIDYKKNEYTSEIAYNGKTVDIIHFSTFGFNVNKLSKGTIIDIDIEKIHPFIDNDEVYLIMRLPHKSLDEIFKPRVDVKNLLSRLRDLITTPVVSEKYGYSIRINESRLLPNEITKIGAFHRQKLKKAVITLSIDEKYELNDSGCYRIRRLEEDLYKDYLPKDYNCDDVITYEWNQNRDYNYQGQFNFYYNISKNYVSKKSMLLYLVLILTIGIFGNFLYDTVKSLFELFV